MNSFATRDQENFIHGQQRVAAAKPLNQGIRGLAPKTPGNNGGKTFTGKLTVRNRGGDDENALGGGKTGKPEKLKFVTPTAPRDRAPLGAKTTNLKTKAFQTPGPLTGGAALQKTQRRTGSAKKAKIKVHQPEAVEVEPISKEEDDEEPEIEYCPPRPIELPDLDDNPYEFKPGEKFPQLEGANYFRGIYTLYNEERHLRQEREEAERREKINAQMEKELNEAAEEALRPENFDSLLPIISSSIQTPKNPTETAINTSQRQQKTNRPNISTLMSKSAAAALSTNSRPRFAAPTQSTAAKRITGGPASPLVHAIPRNTSATAASRTSLGYASGRKASSTLKQKTGRVPASPTYAKSVQPKKAEEEEENRLSDLFLFGSDGDEGVSLMEMLGSGRDWMAELVEPGFRMEMPPVED